MAKKEKFDIFKNELVPKHELLSEEEKQKVLKVLGVEQDKLPKINMKDPVAKRLEAKKKDLIKITRKSLTAGKAVYYRIVV